VEVKECVRRFWDKGYEIMELEECELQTAMSLRVSLRIPSISLREHALPFRRMCNPRERERELCRMEKKHTQVFGTASCAVLSRTHDALL